MRKPSFYIMTILTGSVLGFVILSVVLFVSSLKALSRSPETTSVVLFGVFAVVLALFARLGLKTGKSFVAGFRERSGASKLYLLGALLLLAAFAGVIFSSVPVAVYKELHHRDTQLLAQMLAYFPDVEFARQIMLRCIPALIGGALCMCMFSPKNVP